MIRSAGPTPVSVRMSPLEQDVLFWMAKVRYEPKRASGRTDRKVSTRNGLDVDIHGVRGEATAGKLFDSALYLKMSDGIDRGTDFIFRGKRVSVKHREQARYDYFIIPYWKDHLEADLGILVSPTDDQDRMEVVGWLDTPLFEDKKERCDFMPRPPWGVHKIHLRDLALLGLPPGDPSIRDLRISLDWSEFPLGKPDDTPRDLQDTLDALQWGHAVLMQKKKR